MRFLRLDLLAVGPFTGQTLDFAGLEPTNGESASVRQHRGLHIVYGPNEAGKSSALRAVRHALFGFPARTSDTFVHDNPKLRVGGLLEATDGSRLEFVRRKGNSKTLRDAADAEPIDEARLATWLGGVDEATFSRRFGIDHAELRRGGEAIAKGQGEIADILFAAGAGLADVRAVQTRLDERSSELFLRTGSKPQINQLLARFSEVRKSIKEASLSTSKWTEVDRHLREETATQAKLLDELSLLRAESARLDRIRRSIPLATRRRLLVAELATLADAALLPETFAGDRREAETKLAKARSDAAAAAREIERIEAELAKTCVPVELLEKRNAVAELHTRLGGIAKAAQDRPGLVLKRDDRRRRAEELLGELGRPPRLDEADSLKLPKSRKQRIQELGVECAGLIEKRREGENRAGKLRDDLARLDEALKRIPPTRDVAGLEWAIQRVQREGDLDDKRDGLAREHDRLRHALDAGLAGFALFDGTVEELARMTVPSAETVDRFEAEMGDAGRTVRELEKTLRERDRERGGIDRDLQALRLEGDVPSEAELLEARAERDRAWDGVLAAWRDGKAPDDATELAGGYRRRVEQADTLADRLRREAERVERRARLNAELIEADRLIEDDRTRCDQARAVEADLLARWRDLWREARVEPLPPREMRAWRTRQQALAADAVRLGELALDLDRVTRRIDEQRELLADALAGFGAEGPAASEPLSATLDRAIAVRDRARRDQQKREADQTRRDDVEKQLAEEGTKSQRVAVDLERWKGEWAEAVAVLGLTADARPTEANAVVEAVDELLGLLKEIRDLDARIDGIDADAARFRDEVGSLVRAVSPDLVERPAEQSVIELHERVDRAGQDHTRRTGLEKQLRTEQGRGQAAAADIATCRESLDKLRALAGDVPEERLPEAEERSKRRREADAKLREIDRQLNELTGGATLDDWLAGAGEWDADRVAADLERLEREFGELSRRHTEVSEQVGTHRAELARMDGGRTAADAQDEAEQLLAEIRARAEEFVRLKLAGVVLGRAMERFRASAQGPVLSRASDLFAALTLHSFSGLRPDYDDKGTPVLKGVRAGTGEMVPVEGMSDGTCDQLYLAVRLALLEPSLAGREPLPLIVDDILVLFDDDRATAALRVLAEFSARTQVIFFTHHARIVELAETGLPTGSANIVRLGRNGANK
jgi:uncharacterized protein YhaN